MKRLALVDARDGGVICTAHTGDFKSEDHARAYLDHQRDTWSRQAGYSETWGPLVIRTHGRHL